MIAQRPPGRARVLRASAEALPLADDSADAAMAILSDHHWADRAAGMRELRRVARRRVVLLNADPALVERFWLTRDYLPALAGLVPGYYRRGGWREQLEQRLGGAVELRVLPVPWDCSDGFYAAFWRRPRAYLDPSVRANISIFHRLPAAHVEAGLASLARDLETGAWQAREAALLELDALDVGMRLVVAELG